MKMIRAASLWAECLNLCGTGSKYNLLRSHDGLAKKIAKNILLNLELEELRSKYNRSNQAGSSYKTELQSALEDNSCKDI